MACLSRCMLYMLMTIRIMNSQSTMQHAAAFGLALNGRKPGPISNPNTSQDPHPKLPLQLVWHRPAYSVHQRRTAKIWRFGSHLHQDTPCCCTMIYSFRLLCQHLLASWLFLSDEQTVISYLDGQGGLCNPTFIDLIGANWCTSLVNCKDPWEDRFMISTESSCWLGGQSVRAAHDGVTGALSSAEAKPDCPLPPKLLKLQHAAHLKWLESAFMTSSGAYYIESQKTAAIAILYQSSINQMQLPEISLCDMPCTTSTLPGNA